MADEATIVIARPAKCMCGRFVKVESVSYEMSFGEIHSLKAINADCSRCGKVDISSVESAEGIPSWWWDGEFDD